MYSLKRNYFIPSSERLHIFVNLLSVLYASFVYQCIYDYRWLKLQSFTTVYSWFHKTFAKIFQISFQSSQVRCEVQKFILKFKSQFLNKAPIGLWIEIIQSNALFKKPGCDFQLWTLNFTMDLPTLERNLEYFGKSFVKSTVRATCYLAKSNLLFTGLGNC